ncbi:hypothetical protein BaRGS_00009975 [Batillaria attramentaria]|uniref:HNH nuclease domain-containing protein n=1 Tax=Batillaria attramentaria TaxID=370345 RepID=A0ABD0LI88_9CAEN
MAPCKRHSLEENFASRVNGLLIAPTPHADRLTWHVQPESKYHFLVHIHHLARHETQPDRLSAQFFHPAEKQATYQRDGHCERGIAGGSLRVGTGPPRSCKSSARGEQGGDTLVVGHVLLLVADKPYDARQARSVSNRQGTAGNAEGEEDKEQQDTEAFIYHVAVFHSRRLVQNLAGIMHPLAPLSLAPSLSPVDGGRRRKKDSADAADIRDKAEGILWAWVPLVEATGLSVAHPPQSPYRPLEYTLQDAKPKVLELRNPQMTLHHGIVAAVIEWCHTCPSGVMRTVLEA